MAPRTLSTGTPERSVVPAGGRLERLYRADPIRHFLEWLALYLVISIVAINLGSAAGMSDHVAVALPLAGLAVVLLAHLRRTGIGVDIGLGVPASVSASRMWFYLPLLLLVALPLLGGVRDDLTTVVVIAILVQFVSVGFLEEALFRGLLLRAMLREGKPVWAVIVSTLTFGIGHAASMLVGQSGTDTVLQIINATVVGLILTLVVLATGSLTVVIVVHALYNIIATLSSDTDGTGLIVAGLVVLLVYGTWVLFGAGALTRLRHVAPGDRHMRSAPPS